jgi:hypothetical protein
MLPIMPFWSAETWPVGRLSKSCAQAPQHVKGHYIKRGTRTLVDHLLDGARRVDLHCEEIIKPVHFRRLL